MVSCLVVKYNFLLHNDDKYFILKILFLNYILK